MRLPMTFDQWLAIAGLAGTVIGILLAVYFYLRSKRKVRLSYHVEQTELLGGSKSALPEEVSISYQNTPIRNLRKMNIIIWNSGTEPIRRSDIVGNAPIKLALPEGSRLLKPSLLKVSSDHNGVSIVHASDIDSSVAMEFLYLEPKQGFNVEILYSGDESIPDVQITIIGMPKGIQRFTMEYLIRKGDIPGILVIIFLLMGFIPGLGVAWAIIRPNEAIDYLGLLSIGGAIGFLFALAFLWVWAKWVLRTVAFAEHLKT
jgi:hypothetical protein